MMKTQWYTKKTLVNVHNKEWCTRNPPSCKLLKTKKLSKAHDFFLYRIGLRGIVKSMPSAIKQTPVFFTLLMFTAKSNMMKQKTLHLDLQKMEQLYENHPIHSLNHPPICLWDRWRYVLEFQARNGDHRWLKYFFGNFCSRLS